MSEAEKFAAQAATANTAVDLDQQGHDRRDIEVLYKIYMDKRLESQIAFYESRVLENQSNADFTFTVSTGVMAISAFVATVSALINSPIFSLLSAILPAFAALLAAFRQLYGWERQISIYRDALLGLERVKLITPDKARMPLVDLPAIYPKLVANGESVFTGEVNQWGQFVQNTDKSADDAANALMGNLQLTDAQIATIRKIVEAGKPKPAFGQHTITVHPEETGALVSGGVAGDAPPMTSPDTDSMYEEDAPTAVDEDGSVIEDIVPPMQEDSYAGQAEAEPQIEYDAPPPEAISALSPGAMHVSAPQPPPEFADREQDPNANG